MDKREILAKLQAVESQYSEEWHMITEKAASPGYHTRIPDGVPAHRTVTAINYAWAIFASGEEKYFARGEEVIRAVLKLQVSDPYDKAFGVWPWFAEEPVEKMAPPDWNWAGFIGAPICHILLDYSSCISEELKTEMTIALERAAWCIFRRNMHPNYTNIALMGAAVTAAAGDILNNDLLRDYARSRIRHFLEHTGKQGSFNEYNSPTYTFVALAEIERILQLARDPETLACAEKVRVWAWKMLAGHFHPATGQLAGPHFRAYSELLGEANRKLLEEQTGIPVFTPGNMPLPAADAFSFSDVRYHACPEEFKKYFIPSQEERVCTQTFQQTDDPAFNVSGTTWIKGEASIGSATRVFFWDQCRPLQGYWRNGNDVAVLRGNVVKNGRSFASMGAYNSQEKNRVLTTFHGLTDTGDFHCGLDPAPGRLFPISSLVVQYRLTGKGAYAQQIADGIFELICGSYKAVVHFPETECMEFDGRSVFCRCRTEEDAAYAELVCHEGDEIKVLYQPSLTMKLAGAVEILPAGVQADCDRPEISGNTAIWRQIRTEIAPAACRFWKVEE